MEEGPAAPDLAGLSRMPQEARRLIRILQMRILVAVESIDGRKGIDSLAQRTGKNSRADPFSGCLFIFHQPPWNRHQTAGLREVWPGHEAFVEEALLLVAHG